MKLDKDLVLCIVQARLSSSRLPRKVLADLGGISVLELIVLRLSQCQRIDQIVVATTSEPVDKELVEFCTNRGISFFQGSSIDVLQRFYTVSEKYSEFETLVRITADCPFVDPKQVGKLINMLKRKKLDYISNRLPPPLKRRTPIGLDIEVFTRDYLKYANSNADKKYEREHVTPFMYLNPGTNRKIRIVHSMRNNSHIRVTIDTQQDLDNCRLLYSKMKNNFDSSQQIIKIYRKLKTRNLLHEGKQNSYSELDHRWD